MSKLIPLTQGLAAVVDDDRYDEMASVKWYAYHNGRTWYARRSLYLPDRSRRTVLMHRVILPGVERVDHIDGNGLNNRVANLRSATCAQNGQNHRRRASNQSGYMGVWKTSDGKWSAEVRAHPRRIYVGVFDTPEEAARARDLVAIEAHGAFAKLNFPELASGQERAA